MRAKGLTLIEEGETKTVPVTVSEDPAELGVQDYLIVTLKGPLGATGGGQDAASHRRRDDHRFGA